MHDLQDHQQLTLSKAWRGSVSDGYINPFVMCCRRCHYKGSSFAKIDLSRSPRYFFDLMARLDLQSDSLQ